MIPIADRNPTSRIPVINYLLIATNILVFLYELSLSPGQLDAFMTRWGVESVQVIALLHGALGLLLPVIMRALVSMFVHGGWLHIGSNMLFLWIFGDNIEDNFGSGPYLGFYLISGLGAVIAAFAGGEFPDDDGRVVSSRGEQLAVGTEGQGAHRLGVRALPLDRHSVRAGGHVPQFDRRVGAA